MEMCYMVRNCIGRAGGGVDFGRVGELLVTTARRWVGVFGCVIMT